MSTLNTGSVDKLFRRMAMWDDRYGYFGAPGNAKQRRKLRRFAERAGLYVMPAFHRGGIGQWRGDRA